MKELDYFTVDRALGWNQNWFPDWSMYDGGCAAVTACDLCILLARLPRFAALYPGDPFHVTREDYLAFSQEMKPYLHPRWQGIDTLELYLSGLTAYWRDAGVSGLRGKGLPGSASWTQARELVRAQIDAGIPTPCLLLYHRNPIFRDFQWHWFNLAGYEEFDGDFLVRAVTYGTDFWLDLRELWNTGRRRKGGLIQIEMEGA